MMKFDLEDAKKSLALINSDEKKKEAIMGLSAARMIFSTWNIAIWLIFVLSFTGILGMFYYHSIADMNYRIKKLEVTYKTSCGCKGEKE
jgi:hypothetical protein